MVYIKIKNSEWTFHIKKERVCQALIKCVWVLKDTLD